MIQEFRFYGSGDARHGSKKKVKSYVIVAGRADGFKKGTISVDLKVPSTPPTECMTSKIIYIKYWVKVCEGCHLEFLLVLYGRFFTHFGFNRLLAQLTTVANVI